MKSPFKDRLLLAAFLFILVVFGALVARKYLLSPSTPPPASLAPAPEEVKQLREVTLYFGSTAGTYLVPESREIEDCLVERDCIRSTVQALLDGSLGDLVPLLPSQTQLRDVIMEDGTAVLDFSRELVTGHPGGSISEILTVYGLADTLAVNFPHVRQIRILVEGQPFETLNGHLGLQEPVKADFRYTRPPDGSGPGKEGAPAGKLTAEPAEKGGTL